MFGLWFHFQMQVAFRNFDISFCLYQYLKKINMESTLFCYKCNHFIFPLWSIFCFSKKCLSFFTMNVEPIKQKLDSFSPSQIWVQTWALSSLLLLFQRLHITKLWASTNLIANYNTLNAVGSDTSTREKIKNKGICLSCSYRMLSVIRHHNQGN